MSDENNKLTEVIAKAEAIINELSEKDPSFEVVQNLIDQANRSHRRFERLIKRSDATEASLFETNKKLETLTKTLARFVPQTVVDVLMQGGADQVAKIERRNLTVFFSDVVGFSTIATRQEPETLAMLLMEYFTEMSKICAHYGGTLDQFIGDAIVIFFGDPETKGAQGDAIAAVEMALEMQIKMEELRVKWRSDGLNQDLHVRMGISTGYCTVGNFGSSERLNYTAIGNAVNEAARIEELAPADRVIVSADTQNLIKDQIDTVSIGSAELKGRDHPVELFEAKAKHLEGAKRLTALSADGFRLFIDPKNITDKAEIEAALNAALNKLDEF